MLYSRVYSWRGRLLRYDYWCDMLVEYDVVFGVVVVWVDWGGCVMEVEDEVVVGGWERGGR